MNKEYGLDGKLIATVTDSGSNFVKAFIDFGITSFGLIPDDDDDFSDNESNENFTPIPCPILPQKKDCGSHVLNLVGSPDIQKLFVKSKRFKKIYDSAIRKVHALWNRSSRSSGAHEKIGAILKAALVTPGDARWNSTQDSIQFLLKYEFVTIKRLLLELDLETLTQLEWQFFQEYYNVLKPISIALNRLQSPNGYYSILLPTVHTIKEDLECLNSLNLQFFKLLLEHVVESVHTRFKYLFDPFNEKCFDALVATCSHPYFK